MSAIGIADRPHPARKGKHIGAWHVPRMSKLLHWAVAVLVGALALLGTSIRVVPSGALADTLFIVHKTLGLATFVLILLRLGYRGVAMARRRWGHSVGMHVVHFALYCCMLLVPLLGWAGVSDFSARQIAFGLVVPAILPEGGGWSELLFNAHGVLAYLLMALVVVHIGIALGDHVTRGTEPS